MKENGRGRLFFVRRPGHPNIDPFGPFRSTLNNAQLEHELELER